MRRTTRFLSIATLSLIAAALLFAPETQSNAPASKIVGQGTSDVIINGNISVRSALNGNIVLIVDSGVAAEPDGVPDMIVRFAPRKSTYQNVSFELIGARLFLSSRRVAVLGEDGHTWVSLSLERVKLDDPAYGLYGATGADLPQTIRLSRGFALQWNTVARTADGSAPDVDIERPILIPRAESRNRGITISEEGDPESLPCTAGGRGAISCSYSCNNQQCSITCGAGTYACCGCTFSRTGFPYCNCRAS